MEGARALGADSRGIKQADAGLFLADTVKKYMYDLGCPDGLGAMGFDSSDVDQLVTVCIRKFDCNKIKIKGTLPQERVTKLAPRQFTPEDLGNIFSNSMKNY